jgi:hypothetical protein
MRHLQTKVSDEEFKCFHDMKVDLGMSMEQLILLALEEKYERHQFNREQSANTQTA